MQRNQVLAYSVGSITLLAALVLYQEVQFMGFPDGFLSELDRARRVMLWVMIGLSLPTALWFFALGRQAARTQVGPQLSVSLAGYGAYMALLWLIDLYLRRNLIGSGGG
jgi:hypothetical protein